MTRLQAENAALAKKLTRAKRALQQSKPGVTYLLAHSGRNTPGRVRREDFQAAQAAFQEERVAELQAEIAALKDENTKLRGEIAKKSKSAAPKPREP